MLKCYFLVLLILVGSSTQAAFVELIKNPQTPTIVSQVELPFQYHAVKPEESFIYVLEGSGALLKPDSKKDYMILGPLNPCIGIIFHNKKNGFQLGFHKHITNSFESMAEIFDHFLEVVDPSQVMVQLYSHQLSDEIYSKFIQLGAKTQLQEMEDTQEFIMQKLKIPQENIRVLLWESKDMHLGQYYYAELNLLIDKEGHIFNTCNLAEDLMKQRGTRLSYLDIFDTDSQEQIFKTYGPLYTGTLFERTKVLAGKVNFDTLLLQDQIIASANEIKYRTHEQYLKTLGMDPFSESKLTVQQKYRKIPFYLKIPKTELKLHCFHCHQERPTLKQCLICKKAFYCNKACQKKDWPQHKKTCKQT